MGFEGRCLGMRLKNIMTWGDVSLAGGITLRCETAKVYYQCTNLKVQTIIMSIQVFCWILENSRW